MKRYIKCMGVLKPAHLVEAHNEYGPTIQIGTLKTLLKVADRTNNKLLADGLTQLVIDDLCTDIDSGGVDLNDAIDFYVNFYYVICDSKCVSNKMCARLEELLDDENF